MSIDNKTDLKDLMRDIENNKILLPDFQREFEWKDENKQRSLVCSILTKLPIGSILLLKSKADDYICKKIGSKTTFDNQSKEPALFLLDGQQRITVLANAFSNVIFDNCKRISDLTSPALKKRFFLRIPKWISIWNNNEKDLFGIKNLNFPIESPDSDVPDFLTSEIREFIEIITFKKDDEKPYNPYVELNPKLDDFCITYDKGYLFPLYLLAPTDGKNKKQIETRYDSIIEKIAQKIYDEIIYHYINLQDKKEKEIFISTLWDYDKETKDRLIKDIDNSDLFYDELKNSKKYWMKKTVEYLNSCIRDAILDKIEIAAKQRSRAIDVYENLNRGGIVLGLFDLIIARAAGSKNGKTNLRERIINNITTKKTYSNALVPHYLQYVIEDKLNNETYNASLFINAYNSDKNEISKKYIDSFLNVLSIYSYNKDLDEDKIKIDLIKRDKILDLTAEKIDNNCEKVCAALDRTFFFLQVRCGIRNLNDVNYDLLITLFATIFINDNYFNDWKIHDSLEAYYWAALFSGRYDKDQTKVVIEDISKILKSIKSKEFGWLRQATKKMPDDSENPNGVFTNPNFSNRKLILMERAADTNDGEEPKRVLRNFICQFFLSKTYTDMFDMNKKISVFCEEANELEMHHIVPLGSVKKYGETTEAARKNPSHICNSPVNFVYITKNSNIAISQDPLQVYSQKITDMAKSQLKINDSYGKMSVVPKDDEIKTILENRFTAIKGAVETRIIECLEGFN